MVGTLLVSPDGTSCGASMVKMSVDFPSEAALCQRFLSARAQSNFDSRSKCGPFCFAQSELLALPLAYPSAPSVISKRKEPPRRNKDVNLRPERRRFRRPKVIVDHEPAGIVKQVTVAIQIPTHVIVRVENKQANLGAAQALTNFRNNCIVRGAPVDQSNVFCYAEPREVPFQILDDVPAR